MPIAAQVSAKTESTWNTPVTVDRSFVFDSESIVGTYQRTESVSIRSGQRGLPAGQYVPWYAGGAGAWVFKPQTKGFGMWLVHLLGAVATVGPTDSAYTHTGTVAALNGKGFTWQVNRQFYPSGTDQAFTYAGGKITQWELACDKEGLLTATFNMDFAAESTATALAAAAYPTGAEPFYWTKAVVSIGGVNVDLMSFKASCNNNLQVDRRYLRNSSAKNEQVEAGFREVAFEAVADWSSLTQYNRFSAATAAGAEAQIIATFTGPTLIGATTYPAIVVTLPAARFDGTTPAVSNLEPLSVNLSGKGLVHATNGQIKVDYVTSDATP
jgi:hypothetical protein